MSMIHLCGYIQDRADERDYPFAALAAQLTSSGRYGTGAEHVISYSRPTRDQIGPSCVGHSCVRAVEILNPTLPDLSGRALWYLARQATGTADQNSGTYIRTGLAQLRRVGVPSLAFDSETDPHNAGLRTGALLDANDHRGGEFYRINTGDVAAVEQALRANHPVVVGGQVDDAFAYARSDTLITAPVGKLLGGHATCLVGVRGVGESLQVLIDNSWGTGWGDGGRCWADVAWLRSRWDLWVLTRGVEE